MELDFDTLSTCFTRAGTRQMRAHRPRQVVPWGAIREDFIAGQAEARAVVGKVCECLVSFATEPTRRVVPEAYLCLEKIEIIVARDYPNKSSQLQPCEFVYISSFIMAGFIVEASRVVCLLYTSPSPRDRQKSRMPSSA